MTNPIWGTLSLGLQYITSLIANPNLTSPPAATPVPAAPPPQGSLPPSANWKNISLLWSPPTPWKNYSLGHPSFAPEWGRVTRCFDAEPVQREWQAEQILRRFDRWPPPEGEVYMIQIDQDSPPPPKKPGPQTPPNELRAQIENYKADLAELNSYLTGFTGQTSLFRAQRVNGILGLVELTPGPLRSASHPGQLDPAGQASCNETVCGMAWLRNGIYPYYGKTSGVFNPVQDSLMSVARDINTNGAIDEKESATSARAFGFAIQLHAGFPWAPRSVGCQTFPPDDFNVLQKAVFDTGVTTFSYVLVRRPHERLGPRPW